MRSLCHSRTVFNNVVFFMAKLEKFIGYFKSSSRLQGISKLRKRPWTDLPPKVTPNGYFLFRLTFHFRLFSLDWCQKIIKIPNVISKAFTTEKLKPDSVCEIIVSCWLFFRGSPNCFTSSRYTVMKFRRRAICLKVLICCVLPLIASVPAANVSELERLFSN